MKNSLSFINAKLGATKTTNTLTNSEISQLQERLASTEAQMYQILSALDAASVKMNEITKHTRQSLEQPHQVCIHPSNAQSIYLLIFSLSIVMKNIVYHHDRLAKVNAAQMKKKLPIVMRILFIMMNKFYSIKMNKKKKVHPMKKMMMSLRRSTTTTTKRVMTMKKTKKKKKNPPHIVTV